VGAGASGTLLPDCVGGLPAGATVLAGAIVLAGCGRVAATCGSLPGEANVVVPGRGCVGVAGAPDPP